jgi:predicted deacylase
MTDRFKIGDVTAAPGEIRYGRWQALTHPTGHEEFFPVIVAQGREDGPCFWLTAGVHGSEQAGPLVLYELLTRDLVNRLKGTVVAIPALNPAGLRTRTRNPYHADVDPNRLWPEEKTDRTDLPDFDPPTSLEQAYLRLYREMTATADYLIDYHNAWIGSLSFALRDRILYRGDDSKDQARAQALSDQLDDMLKAYGHTVVTEYPAETYIRENLHRTTSGSVLQKSRILAFTAELGTGLAPDPDIIKAACAGTRNVFRWAGMLSDGIEAIENVRVIRPGYPVRRMRTPRVPEACVVRHLVRAGDRVGKGDVVAELRDVWGRPTGNGVIRSGYEGIVLGRSHGVFFYPGQPICVMAVRDDDAGIAPYPKHYRECMPSS